MGSFLWHVREGSFEGPELASAYRYHPFSVYEPHIGTTTSSSRAPAPWRVIDFQRTDVLESDGNILVVELTIPSARIVQGHFGALRVDVAGHKARFRYETVDGRVRDRFRLTCS